ncbi:amino acid adenylation domain-containing protein [Butyrivibrio sp. LC3010]|uniref:amino acid adenylation domain-containing protein n=1 Tax=Butyrivibrio sp. LC3010 TaxID=1280680 RepID=UPI00041334AE|nr:amino acid adenylation domain-containing protein [Butyrivibrio sp. LC3010]
MQTNVLHWLDNTAKRYPNEMAIIDENYSMTWSQYRKKSLGIAKAIIEMNYGPKRPIVVYLDKSAAVLVSFMGTAYSGNFYSPIDTTMPKARVEKILEILEPGLIITSRNLFSAIKKLDYKGEIIVYEDIRCVDDFGDVLEIQEHILDTDLLYVLFTSGSTGVPKGVCISHGSVIDYIDWVVDTFSISFDDSFGNQAPFYFDNSILDIYSSMKSGAALYLIPRKLFSQPVPLLNYLKEKEISTIFWVPSALIVISKLKALRNVDLTGTLKRILFCGEVMPNKQLNIWRKFLPNVLYANLYGPTEITDACTYYIVDRDFRDDEPLPIGKPMRNTEIMVLDEENKLISDEGKPGELCVRGSCLSKGYYNNKEKTDSAFVQNPINDSYPEKIYRTGDIVQYNEKHELVYMSRKDYQIKHMGHRIELGEIETAVSSLEGVSQCCCLYDEQRCRITLFIDKEIPKEEINQMLMNLIPAYMFPGKVIVMRDMPMNANGKIDRVRLKELL